MMHFNMRSLPTNLTSLNDILTAKETPEIIAISETKLQDENIYNISIPGYSPTRAESVGLYISKELTFIGRRDLEIIGGGIESWWVEIMREKEKNIVIVVSIDTPQKTVPNYIMHSKNNYLT